MHIAPTLTPWSLSLLVGYAAACSSGNAPVGNVGDTIAAGNTNDHTQQATGGDPALGAGGSVALGRGGAKPASGGTKPASGGTTSNQSDGSADARSGDAGGVSCHDAKPGPDNTGVPLGTVLKPSGPIKVETRGAVIEDLDIQGEITVLADDVVIRRVRIRSGDYYPIRYFDNGNRGLVIEDSEIEGTSDDVTAALSFANYTARRLNVHGGADGFKADENVVIEDCWIHDLRNGPDQHNDGVQSTGGKGVAIRHNAISGASNACVQTGDEGGATEDLTVECNWLSGGGYALNIRGTGATRPRNTRIVDNRFGRDSAYGPWTIDDPKPTVTGNAYDDGTPLAYP